MYYDKVNIFDAPKVPSQEQTDIDEYALKNGLEERENFHEESLQANVKISSSDIDFGPLCENMFGYFDDKLREQMFYFDEKFKELKCYFYEKLF